MGSTLGHLILGNSQVAAVLKRGLVATLGPVIRTWGMGMAWTFLWIQGHIE